MNNAHFFVTTSRVKAASTLAAAVVLVYEALSGDWAAVGAAALALISVFVGRGTEAAAITLAIGVGAAAPAVVASVNLGVWIAEKYWVQRGGKPERLDEAALSETVGALPDEISHQLAVVTGPGAVVDTAAIVQAAAMAAPDKWRSYSGGRVLLTPNSEGGPVAGTLFTCCAAEAVLVMRTLALQINVVPDIQLLAAAAAAIPNARAAEPTVAEHATAAAGLAARHLVEALNASTRRPGGELLLERVRLILETEPESSTLLTDSAWSTIRSGDRFDRRKLGQGRPYIDPADILEQKSTSSQHRHSSPAQSAITPIAGTRPKSPPDFPSSSVRASDGFRDGPASNRSAAKAPSQEAIGAGTLTDANEPAIHRRAVRRLRKGGWSGSLLFLWFGVRPLCTLGAVVATMRLVTSNPGIASVASLLVVLFIRPNRLIWLGIAATLVLTVLAPQAAVFVGIRTGVTLAVLITAGHQWSCLPTQVVVFRRSMTGGSAMDEAWRRLASASQSRDPGTEDLPLDELGAVLLAAWCTADVRIEMVTLAQSFRGLVAGRWPSGIVMRPTFDLRIGLLALSESAIERTCAAAAFLTTSLSLLATTEPVGATFFRWQIPALVPVACCGFLARSLVFQGARPFSVAKWAILTALASGTRGFFHVGMGILVGLSALAVRKLLQRQLIAAPIRQPSPPLCLKLPVLWPQWSAARRAVSQGDPEIALKIWKRIATDDQWPALVRAHAWAASAGVELDEGEIHPATQSVGRALSLIPRVSGRRYAQVAATAGRIHLAAGDTPAAEAQLQRALRFRRYRRDPLIMAAQAQLIVYSDPNAAEEMIARSSRGLLWAGRAEEWIDMEVATLAQLSRVKEASYVETRLQEILDFGFDDVDEATERTDRIRLAAAVARGRVLLGQLLVDRGDEAAADCLRRAITDLPRPSDAVDRAIARVLLAAALAKERPVDSLRELITGLDALETARGQLRLGRNRSQLLVRHTDTYTSAFDTLTQLQDTLPHAGSVAAELIESLRRNALAETLRSGPLNIKGEVNNVLTSIAALEASGTADGTLISELRKQLSSALSEIFAAAYLPERVSITTLRRRVGSAHILAYRIYCAQPDRLAGHVVWTPPTGDPIVQPIKIVDPLQLRILGTSEQEDRSEVMAEMHVGERRTAPWNALASMLIPRRLREHLSDSDAKAPAHLVIVADGPLSVLPWPALRIGNVRLVDVATLQHIPTLDMLEEPTSRSAVPIGAPAKAMQMLVYLDTATSSADERYRLSEDDTAVVVSTLPEVLYKLNSKEFVGAYIAAHGDATGLTQALSFDGTGVLSAAGALGVPWPSWVLFASCLVGRTEFKVGEEPLGLLISCMLGGSHSALGGVIEIRNATTGRIGSRVAIAMRSGAHPCEALRDEQLRYLGSPSRPAPPDRWAGLVCFSRRVPDRCTNRSG